jgi:hypothetical protein
VIKDLKVPLEQLDSKEAKEPLVLKEDKVSKVLQV